MHKIIYIDHDRNKVLQYQSRILVKTSLYSVITFNFCVNQLLVVAKIKTIDYIFHYYTIAN